MCVDGNLPCSPSPISLDEDAAPRNICGTHQGHSLILFCKDCRESVCDEGLICGSHRGHNLAKLEDAWKHVIEELKKEVAEVKSSFVKNGNIKNQVAEAKKKIEVIYKMAEEREFDLQGLDGLILEDEQHQASHSQSVEDLGQLTADDSTINLGRIKELSINLEAMKSFYNDLERRIYVDNKRLKSFESSVTRLVKKIKDLLPRPWEFAENVTFDKTTAANNLKMSEDGTSVWYVPSQPQGRRSRKQENGEVNILANEAFSSGQHYWEVEVKGRLNWTVGVVEQGWKEGSAGADLGQDKRSWALQSEDGLLVALHNDENRMLREHDPFARVGVFLDCDNSVLKFMNVDTGRVLHSFSPNVKKPLIPAFSIVSRSCRMARLASILGCSKEMA
ncbi:hypothetical protein AGOR_G00040910 [Albula goreensis]|uniref:B30.2/SPRY domain-containing protein n=1 Tax=Albula goreensis TaxID=1534307 RepID=A0A8T3E5C0_9TELE|nr:hypothetical protein AGOR_G00040910 [Albula goreensis]